MGAIVAANWKMNLRRNSSQALVNKVEEAGYHPWIFPSFPLLPGLSVSGLPLGAQDLSPESDGAYTGDVSAEMLTDAGCTMVLVGHSERRRLHAESADLLLAKLRRAIDGGLKPLYCIGETLEQRDAGRAKEVVLQHLSLLGEMDDPQRKSLCAVAYEPVWAIGTGRTATPDLAQEMHACAREKLNELGMTTPLLYGGSVKPENIEGLLAQQDIDGVLVGGASLKAESLIALCKAASEA